MGSNDNRKAYLNMQNGNTSVPAQAGAKENTGEKKRVLVISETIVLPVERGNRKRIWNLINSFREEGCEVDFLFLQTYSEDDPAATREWIGEEHFITFRNKKRTFPVFLKRKVRKALEILHIPGLMFKYFTLDEAMSPEIDAFMKDLLSRRHYDVVWAEYIFNSRPLLSVPEGTVKVLDTHNAFTFKRQMYEAVGYKNYQYALKKNVEAEGLKRADWVVAIQEEEERFFREIAPEVKHCTIGENMPEREPYVAQGKNVLFLGSYYVVNREGVSHFIRNIWPRVKKLQPDAVLQLAGTICRHVPDSDDYVKLGFVEDLEECYRQARVVINPVHYGTGLNIKTIEALSYAKPLVSHGVGVRGLSSDFPIARVEEDDEAFAQAVAEILADDEKALELSRNTGEFMKRYREKNRQAMREILGTGR